MDCVSSYRIILFGKEKPLWVKWGLVVLITAYGLLVVYHVYEVMYCY